MQKTPFILALGLMLPVIGATAHAQTPPATPPQQQLPPTTPKLNLTLEQRYTIKEIIKDVKADGAPANVQRDGIDSPTGADPGGGECGLRRHERRRM